MYICHCISSNDHESNHLNYLSIVILSEEFGVGKGLSVGDKEENDFESHHHYEVDDGKDVNCPFCLQVKDNVETGFIDGKAKEISIEDKHQVSHKHFEKSWYRFLPPYNSKESKVD